MAPVRITPETAVDTVRQQLDAFVESVAGAGRTPAMLKLADDAARLKRLSESGCLEVELLALGGLHPAWAGVLARWLGIDARVFASFEAEVTSQNRPLDAALPTCVVRMGSDLESPPHRAGATTPPVLVVARGGKDAPDREVLDAILSQVRTRPLSLLVAPKAADWVRAVAGLGGREQFVCQVRELEDLAASEGSLAEEMAEGRWKVAAPLAAHWSIAGALSGLYDAFVVALEKEERAARANKAAVEQRAQRLQGTPMPTELLGEMRSLLQKRFDGFQRQQARRLKDLVVAQDGTLWQEVDAAVGQLDHFDLEKKQKVDAATIPASFRDPILERIRTTLGDFCHASTVALHDFLRDTKQEAEKVVADRDGPPVVLHFDHLPAERADVVIRRGVVIQRPYKGEIPRKGLMDYFMAARRYQMLFFMVFSAFGMSFIRGFTAFSIPVGMMLMTYGMINVINGAKKQRAESEQKELDKARDLMKAELNRAMGEVQKNWDQTLSGFLTEQQSAALELIESAVRTSSALGSQEAAGNKEIVQQQIKSLDAAQRKLTDASKKADVAIQDLGQIRDGLLGFYCAASRPADPAAAPAAKPGAAAAAGVSPQLPAAAAAALAKLPGAAGGAAIPNPAAAGDAAARLAALREKAGGKAAGAGAETPAAGDAAARLAALREKASGKKADQAGAAVLRSKDPA